MPSGGQEDTDISQGSVASHLRCGGIFNNRSRPITIFPDSDSKKL